MCIVWCIQCYDLDPNGSHLLFAAPTTWLVLLCACTCALGRTHQTKHTIIREKIKSSGRSRCVGEGGEELICEPVGVMLWVAAQNLLCDYTSAIVHYDHHILSGVCVCVTSEECAKDVRDHSRPSNSHILLTIVIILKVIPGTAAVLDSNDFRCMNVRELAGSGVICCATRTAICRWVSNF